MPDTSCALDRIISEYDYLKLMINIYITKFYLQMLTVHIFRRVPTTLTSTIRRASHLRFLAGITSGGSALTVIWKHYRVHAAKAPKIRSNEILPILHQVDENKAVSSKSEKFDWNLFWYYLRPQIWIIGCATAVNLNFYSLIHV